MFGGNNAKKVEKGRKKWINKNARIWTDSIKYEESIFFTKRTKKLYESEDLIKNIEVENWRNILNNNTHKLWLLIKRKIKEKTKLFQVQKWRLSKEGKVMRKYKNDWWVDNIIQDVNSPLVHEIRRMRIGCSKLRNHMNKRNLRECKNCDMKVPETNEHFFLVCPKYHLLRTELKNRIDDYLKNLGMKFNTINLLGMNEKVMMSKRLKKKK